MTTHSYQTILSGDDAANYLRNLEAEGRLDEWCKELGRLRSVRQDARYHPEGDVLEHSLQALEWAIELTKQPVLGCVQPTGATDPADHPRPAVVRIGALLHDIGKYESTSHNEDGSITSYGHADTGAELAAKLLDRWGVDEETSAAVTRIIKSHMGVHSIPPGQELTERAVNRMRRRLYPATMYEWALVCEADTQGRVAGGLTEADLVRIVETDPRKSRAWEWLA